ncbi:hypothetical protein BH10ACI1_BH10ACI1_17870 [soil metagenome]
MKKVFLMIALTILFSSFVAAQGNGFSFQGRMNDGTNPANGQYDMQFSLYTSISGGTQIGATIARPATVLINGVFSVTLDFGAAAFNNPNAVFIEIAVKPANSANNYTILGPRQQLTVVPFAIRANNATNADNATNAQTAVNATNATTATTAVTATNALSLGGTAASEYARLNAMNTGDLRATGNLTLGGGFGSTGNLDMSGDLTLTGSGQVTVSGGNLNIVGNARQPVASNGFVKAMIYVNINGGILRCYNGITGTSTGNCGFTVSRLTFSYDINFGFRVIDRFVAVTPQTATVNIVASFDFNSNFPNQLQVWTNITDVDRSNSPTPSPFMIVVY